MSLRPLTDAEPLIAQLERFPALYGAAVQRRFCWRLGVEPGTQAGPMVEAAVRGMTATDTPIDRFFHDWRGGIAPPPSGYEDDAWHAFREAIAGFQPVPQARDHAYWDDAAPCSMHIEEVEAIWSAIDQDDDWTPLHAKVAAIRRMGAAHGGAATSRR